MFGTPTSSIFFLSNQRSRSPKTSWSVSCSFWSCYCSLLLEMLNGAFSIPVHAEFVVCASHLRYAVGVAKDGHLFAVVAPCAVIVQFRGAKGVVCATWARTVAGETFSAVAAELPSLLSFVARTVPFPRREQDWGPFVGWGPQAKLCFNRLLCTVVAFKLVLPLFAFPLLPFFSIIDLSIHHLTACLLS